MPSQEPSPNTRSSSQVDLEMKSGVIKVSSEAKTHLRVNGLRGSYKNVRFDDNFLSTGPVSNDVEQELTEMFGEHVERVAAPKPSK